MGNSYGGWEMKGNTGSLARRDCSSYSKIERIFSPIHPTANIIQWYVDRKYGDFLREMERAARESSSNAVYHLPTLSALPVLYDILVFCDCDPWRVVFQIYNTYKKYTRDICNPLWLPQMSQSLSKLYIFAVEKLKILHFVSMNIYNISSCLKKRKSRIWRRLWEFFRYEEHRYKHISDIQDHFRLGPRRSCTSGLEAIL